MPRSKREKEVSLTKVKKKTRETKVTLVEEVRNSVDEYKNLFVYSFENLRTTKFIQVRQHFKATSRFFFGKTNVMAVALGRTPENEQADGLSKVSNSLKGQCGLMFTNEDVDTIKKYFAELKESDFARAGDVATETVVLEEGPLPQFPFSIEPQLRKLGLPTKLEKGEVHLYQDFKVCEEGEPLNTEQAKILKMLDYKLAEFTVALKSHWSKSTGYNAL